MRLNKNTKLDNSGEKSLLKLKKNFYGLRSAGLTWLQHISKGFTDRGWLAPDIDSCLFATGKVIFV
jgi:hypothetical protein